MGIHCQSPSTQEPLQHTSPALVRAFPSVLSASRGHQSELAYQLHQQSPRPIITAGPRGAAWGVPLFSLHQAVICSPGVSCLSLTQWVLLLCRIAFPQLAIPGSRTHIAPTFADQKMGNKFPFHLSGNLSSPGVWGHVRIFSPG